MEGPRAVRPEELDSLIEMADLIFRGGKARMARHYPHLFGLHNLDNLRVFVDEGRVVSHCGMTIRPATLLGHAIRVCSIGGVSTLEDYRGQGLAGCLFHDCVGKARAEGVDLMLVSGDRSLYRRAFCRRVGRDASYLLTRESAERLGTGSMAVQTMTASTVQEAAALHRGEPTRFGRPAEDWRDYLASKNCMNRASELYLIHREEGPATAYAVIQEPNGEGRALVGEIAGSRRCLLDALPVLMDASGAKELRLHVLRHDAVLRGLLAAAGLEGAPTHASGTYRLVNFPQLMAKLRPCFAEIGGHEMARELIFTQADRQCVISRGEDRVACDDPGAMVELLFGTVEGKEVESLKGGGAVAELLAQALPLPALLYGISYV